jgi:hypothetical protein
MTILRFSLFLVGSAAFALGGACTVDLFPDPVDCDYSFTAIANSDSLSSDCRDEALAEAPDPVSEFQSRLAVLGDATDPSSGTRRLFFVGADDMGAPLNFVDTPLNVSVDLDGDTIELTSDDFDSCELRGEDVSVTLVNDYSTSVGSVELEDFAAMERQLLLGLPDGHEGQVIFYSDAVELVQETTDSDVVLRAAVEPSQTFPRGSTALYDGFGTGLDRLRARNRPVRILVVGTNGQDNASSTYDQPTVVVTAEQGEVFVVTLTTFAADIQEMTELQGPRGLLFYAPTSDALSELFTPFVDSVKTMGCIELSADHAGASRVTIEAAGQVAEWETP